MKSLRRQCAVVALLAAGWAAPAHAQLNPYGLSANYPSTGQAPTARIGLWRDQQPESYRRAPVYVDPQMVHAGPGGQGVDANFASLMGGGPAVAPLEPNAGYEAGSGNADIAPSYDAYGSGAACSDGGVGIAGAGLAGDGYGYAACDYPPPRTIGAYGWFGSASGLLMTRDLGNHYTYSYERTNEANQLTDSRNADIGWGGGFDLRFGKYFNCGQNAIQAVYWGLFPETGTTITTTDGITQLDAILNFSQLDYNGGAANLLTDDAQMHVLFRDNEFHNVEVNLLQFVGGGSGVWGPLSYNFLAGVRYFKFRDNLLFVADTIDRQVTGAAEEVNYQIDLDNNLIGFQIGTEGSYCASNRLSFDFGTKIGVFGNHVEHLSWIGGSAGTAVINNGPNLGREFVVNNSKNDVAFLAELDLGANYCINDCWSLIGGYRAVAVTGVALPTNQIYPDLRGIQDVEQVASNGSLILHGGYFGVECNY